MLSICPNNCSSSAQDEIYKYDMDAEDWTALPGRLTEADYSVAVTYVEKEYFPGCKP